VKEFPQAMTAPDSNGAPSLPKRQAPKGLLPLSWLGRGARIEYVDAKGKGVETSRKLLDVYPTGVILNIGGSRTLLVWERLVLVELVEG